MSRYNRRPARQKVTATADGAGAAVIADATDFATITSANASHLVTLPTPVAGRTVSMYIGATGAALQPDDAAVSINGALSSTALAANTTVTCLAASDTEWLCTTMATDGQIDSAPLLYIDAVRDHGADNTGASNTGAALLSAVTAAAAVKLPLFIPPGSYRVNVEFTVPSDCDVHAYNALFLTYIAGLGNSGAPAPTVNIQNVSNVIIRGLEIDGRKASFASTEYKHGINLDGATNVLIEDVSVHDNKGDGIALNDMNPGVHNRNVFVRNSRFNSNHRGGAFVGDGQHVLFEHCEMRLHTGTSPMFGIDVEPDRPDVICEDIVFYHCDHSDNGTGGDGAGAYVVAKAKISDTATSGSTTTVAKAAAGWTVNAYRDCMVKMLSGLAIGEERIITGNTSTTLTVSPAFDGGAVANTDTFEIVPRHRNITFRECRSHANEIHGYLIYAARGVTIENCDIVLNKSRGIEVRGDTESVTIAKSRLRDNVGHGIYLGQSGKTLVNTKIVDNNLFGGHDGGDAIELDSGATYVDVFIDGNFTDSNWRNGLRVAGTFATPSIRLGINNLNGYIARTNGLSRLNTIPSDVFITTIGDGVNNITTGVVAAQDRPIPHNYVPLGWDIVDPQATGGTAAIAVDAWSDTYANYPPAVADTVAGSEKPTLASGVVKGQDTALTTWSDLVRDNWLRWNVDSVAGSLKLARIALAVARVG